MHIIKRSVRNGLTEFVVGCSIVHCHAGIHGFSPGANMVAFCVSFSFRFCVCFNGFIFTRSYWLPWPEIYIFVLDISRGATVAAIGVLQGVNWTIIFV